MLFNVHLVCVGVRMVCDVPGLYSCARGDGFRVLPLCIITWVGSKAAGSRAVVDAPACGVIKATGSQVPYENGGAWGVVGVS